MSHTQRPTCITSVSLFVCIITSDLSYLPSSYSSADIALLIMWPRRSHHYAIPCPNSNRVPAYQRVSSPGDVLWSVQSINKLTDIGPLFGCVTLFWLRWEQIRVLIISCYCSRIPVKGQREPLGRPRSKAGALAEIMKALKTFATTLEL
jgi:hypothetical protein